jgi:hypothetical protein
MKVDYMLIGVYNSWKKEELDVCNQLHVLGFSVCSVFKGLLKLLLDAN